MKQLLLFRHAKSSWADPGQDDHDRPLNARGRRAAGLMAGWMLQSGWQPDLALCSSAARTRETLAIVMQTLPIAEMVTEPALYLAGAEKLRRRVGQLEDRHARVMIVAHNPGIEDLARGIDRGADAASRRLRQKFPTAGAAWFRSASPDWRGFFAAGPELVAFMTPAEFAAEHED